VTPDEIIYERAGGPAEGLVVGRLLAGSATSLEVSVVSNATICAVGLLWRSNVNATSYTQHFTGTAVANLPASRLALYTTTNCLAGGAPRKAATGAEFDTWARREVWTCVPSTRVEVALSKRVGPDSRDARRGSFAKTLQRGPNLSFPLSQVATLHFDEGFDIERFGFVEPLVTDAQGVSLLNVTSLVYLTPEASTDAPTPRPS